MRMVRSRGPDLPQQHHQRREDRVIAETKLQLKAAGRPYRIRDGDLGQRIHDHFAALALVPPAPSVA